MIQYLLDNKEWIFSGIGVFVLSALVTLFYNKLKKNKTSITNKISSPIKLNESNSNTIQLINNQTNYEAEKRGEKNPEIKESLKTVYSLLDKTIKSAEIGLSLVKINQVKDDAEYLVEIVNNYEELVNYHDSNDFLYSNEINEKLFQIRDLLFNAMKQKRMLLDCQNMGFCDDILYKEIDKMDKIYEANIRNQIPLLKRQLSEKINNYIMN